VTNNGPFATVATMSWENGNPQGVFSFEPPSLPLAEGETKEVVVWAFPKEVGVFEDALLVSLQDNPSAYRFPMTATGQLPALTLKGACTFRSHCRPLNAYLSTYHIPPCSLYAIASPSCCPPFRLYLV
jgi:hypothetical protein